MMTKEEYDKIMAKALPLADRILATEKQIQDFLDDSMKVFKVCDNLFHDVNGYLKAPVNSNWTPPIPAFEDDSRKEAAREAINIMMILIQDATTRLKEFTAFHNRFDFYHHHSSECIKELKENHAHPGEKPKWAKLVKPAEKLPVFEKQVVKFLAEIPAYQARLDDLNQQLQVIKTIK